METKKAKRSDFPPLFIYKKGELPVNFVKEKGMREVKKMSDITCQITFYKFPNNEEASRFVDGLSLHPQQDDDVVGYATIKNFVMVAEYNTGSTVKTYLEVLPFHSSKA